MTPKKIVQKFIKLEKQNKVFEMKVDNIFFYQLIRMQLYSYIVGEKKIYRNQDYSYKNILVIIFNIAKELFFWIKKKKLLDNEVCIIRHGRKLNGRDVYTYYLEKIIKKKTILHQSLGQRNYLDKNSINYDLYTFKKKLLIFLGRSNPDKNKEVKKLIKIFKEAFSLDNNFESKMCNYIQNQLNAYFVAKNFLKNTKFKKIIVVNSYGNLGLIYAANQLNIDTIELQHGDIHQNHLGYHFPKIKINKLMSFPKKLILFGEFWRDKANFPIKNSQIIALGSPYFDENFKKLKKLKKSKNNRVLVLSQQTIQKYLLEFIKIIISNNNKIQFTYKAHPKENMIIVKKFFTKNNLEKNVKVINGNENIYRLFEKHTIQIGVFSHSLYEGYSCKLKTGVIKFPGWQNMTSFLNYPNVYSIRNYIDFNNMINNPTKNFSSNFYKPDAKKNFKIFFKQINLF